MGSAQQLKDELDRIVDLLDHQPLFSLSDRERRSLRESASELQGKLGAIETEFLTIGLLGGTGVGKSAVMNALAGAPIAATSHRRPYTDRVLIYRHEEADPVSGLELTGVPWQEVLHQGDAVRHILLCDLPDFDSLAGEHRQQVVRFLEHLDLLVWVTSPEKYGDASFYEFLRVVPKAQRNFYFVLNKSDLFFEGQTREGGYERLEQALRRYRGHLEDAGIAEPLLYPVSALEVTRGDSISPWNQFSGFRQQVFQQRDIKEMKAVKAANLGVEVQALADRFQREVEDLERFDGLLGHSLSELEEMRTSWLEAGQQAIALWLDDRIRNELVKAQSDLRTLVGPSYAVGLLFSLFQRDGKGTAEMPDLTRFKPPDSVALRFRRRLEWIQDRLTTRILRENLPRAFKDRSAEILDVEGSFDDLGERLFDEVAMELNQSRNRPLWRFRLLQWMVYLPLILFLFLVLGGEGPWGRVFTAPGAGSVFDLILSLVHTLFSSKGLAALASFGLVNLFFGLYFYRRYRKVLRRHADRRLALLRSRLERVWEESLDRILQGLEQFRSELRERKSSLNDLLTSSEIPDIQYPT